MSEERPKIAADSIERILDDAAMPPAAYCFKYDLLAEGSHGHSEVVKAFAVHLIGRTEAVMRHANSDEEYGRGFDEGYASADDWLSQHENAMAEHGWVRLPVDADGEVIRLGDMLCVYGEKRVCNGLWLKPSGEWVVSTPTSTHQPSEHGELHHWHKPTPEEEAVKAEIVKALQRAADGESYTLAFAEQEAERIARMAHDRFKADEIAGGERVTRAMAARGGDAS